MKIATLPVLWFATLTAMTAAIAPGDSYEKVIAEKGAPTGKLQAGTAMILRYADCSVRLRDGKVTAVEYAAGARPEADKPAAADRPASPPAPKAKPKRAEEEPAIEARWITDFSSAQSAAKELKRNVFVFFTGSDWCGWCMRLKGEILNRPEFVRYADEKLILVEIDFPRRLPQTAALKAQNEKLARRFDVEGFPTVIVFSPDGKQLGTLGYQEGGPGPFVRRLQDL